MTLAVGTAAGAVALVVDACTAFNDLVPDPTYLDSTDDAARVCTKLFSCASSGLPDAVRLSIGVPVSDDNFSVCMTWLSAPLPSNRIGVDVQRGLVQCLVSNAGGSCDDMASCMFVTPIDPKDAGCSDDGGGDRCIGEGVAVDCARGVEARCGSARYGIAGFCALGANGKTGCSLGGCYVGEFAPSCSDAGVADTCDPTSRLHINEACSAEGLGCHVDGAIASCGEGSCASDLAAQCSDDQGSVDVCDGAVQSTFNCADIGLECLTDANGDAVCGEASGCSPFAGVNTCDASGKTLKVCVAGETLTIDCTKYGAACAPIAAGASSACVIP